MNCHVNLYTGAVSEQIEELEKWRIKIIALIFVPLRC